MGHLLFTSKLSLYPLARQSCYFGCAPLFAQATSGTVGWPGGARVGHKGGVQIVGRSSPISEDNDRKSVARTAELPVEGAVQDEFCSSST